mgnify:CR=1 FL=1
MGIGSLWHWIIVLLIVLILFGRGRISEMMGDFGKGISSFKKGLNETEETAAKAARIAYNADADVPMPSFAGHSPWRSPTEPVPAYPRASNDTSGQAPAPAPALSRSAVPRRKGDPGIEALRAELEVLNREQQRAAMALELAQAQASSNPLARIR